MSVSVTLHAHERRARAREEAATYGGVISRPLLRGLGIHREIVRAELAAERWRAHGDQTIALHREALTDVQARWRAVWEVGVDVALVDGVSALLAHGLTGFLEPVVHVSVVHRHRVRAPAGVVVHKLGRRVPDEAMPAGMPRTRPAIAAVRAAHWARSDRQAATILAMTVQQRLATPAALGAALAVTPHRRRRAVVTAVVAALAGGAQSLGELDFLSLCRRRRLPTPDRQVVRTGPGGRIYLDVRWRCGVVVEVDGAGHRTGLAVSADNLRQNAVALEGDTVLRIDLLGLAVRADDFLDQVAEALRLLGARH